VHHAEITPENRAQSERLIFALSTIKNRNHTIIISLDLFICFSLGIKIYFVLILDSFIQYIAINKDKDHA